MPTLKLITKIWLLVIIPFAFNGVLLFLLYGALAKTAELVEIQQAHTRLLSHLQEGFRLLASSTGEAMTYIFTGDERSRSAEARTVAELHEVAESIRSERKLDAKQLIMLNNIEKMVTQEFNDLTPAKADTSQILGTFERITRSRIMLKEALNRNSDYVQIILAEEKTLDRLHNDQIISNGRVEFLVIIGVIGDLLLVAALAYFVATDLSRKLNLLMTNAERLGKRLPFEDLPPGGDEISYLDEAMRKAALDLQESFEFRSSIMQMVAHDLRSPLMASQVALEVITEFESANINQAVAKQIDRAQKTNSRMLGMINDLLTIENLDGGKLELNRERIDLRETIDDALKVVGALAAGKNIKIANNCQSVTVNADEQKIQQVIINIVSNAIKFSPPNTSIDISSQTTPGHITVSIQDHGPGMTKADCKKIFEKFYQAKNEHSKKGFGLGLAICKMIIEAHDGLINVESSPGEGARFWFNLKTSE